LCRAFWYMHVRVGEQLKWPVFSNPLIYFESSYRSNELFNFKKCVNNLFRTLIITISPRALCGITLRIFGKLQMRESSMSAGPNGVKSVHST